MSGTLYSMAVLRLAAQSGNWPLLGPPASRSTLRSALCGSLVTADVTLDGAGRISTLGLEAKACALGQAAATLLADSAAGRTVEELALVLTHWRDWLAGTCDDFPDWPGLDALGEVKAFPARHAAVRLPFEAVVEAAGAAFWGTAGGTGT